jgi:hypothetical protein
VDLEIKEPVAKLPYFFYTLGSKNALTMRIQLVSQAAFDNAMIYNNPSFSKENS